MFVHKKDDEQLSAEESFASIYDRLTTTDKNRRMPYNKHMETADRAARRHGGKRIARRAGQSQAVRATEEPLN